MTDFFPLAFSAPVSRYAFERYAYTVLYLPEPLARSLPFDRHPRLRVDGEVADLPVAGAWQPAGDGRRYFLLSKRFLREAGLQVGDEAEMRFRVADQDAVDLPDALREALAMDAPFHSVWADLTPGTQRAFAHMVASAKSPATIARRLADVRAMTLAGERPGPKRKRV